jgi:hypothetical protein
MRIKSKRMNIPRVKPFEDKTKKQVNKAKQKTVD